MPRQSCPELWSPITHVPAQLEFRCKQPVATPLFTLLPVCHKLYVPHLKVPRTLHSCLCFSRYNVPFIIPTGTSPHDSLVATLISQHFHFHPNKIVLKLFTKNLSSFLLHCFSLKSQDQLFKNKVRIGSFFGKLWVVEIDVHIPSRFSENHSCNGQHSNSALRGATPLFPLASNPHHHLHTHTHTHTHTTSDF